MESSNSSSQPQMNHQKQYQEQMQKQQELEEQKRILLKEFLTPEAKERIARLALVKPDRAKRIEEIIIQNATSGKITTKLDEIAIINYIEQLNELDKKTETKVNFKRKIGNDSDDDYGIDENL